MEIVAGYLMAVVIGVVLGLMGGGGSILAVPVLFYLFALEAVDATAYSLFIVGVTSMVGAAAFMREGLVNIKTAVIFGIPSIIAVFLTRKFLLPAIPDQLFTLGDFEVTKDVGVIVLFALLMIAASFSMIGGRKNKIETPFEEQQFNYPLIIVEGAVVGLLTGLVGAGGGFLIIPALVILSKLPMKMAVGTSLMIIAAKSLIGFTGDLSNNISIDWQLLGLFTALSVVGILIGKYISRFVAGSKLKPAFGWFTLVAGIVILSEKIFNL
jgi:uncharacterized membrane protein YfcA